MSGCDNSNIRQNYIVVGGGESDISSACTEFYVTNIEACDPVNGISVNSQIEFNGDVTLNSVPSGTSQNVLVIDGNGLVSYTNDISGSAVVLNGHPLAGTIIFVLGFVAKVVSNFFEEDENAK